MKFKKLGAAILATGIIALSATPANALEHGELAPDTPRKPHCGFTQDWSCG